jgi:PAT family beta-lactamase induction signal transducer AmpG
MVTGYGGYFIITVLAVIPAMLLFVFLTPRFRRIERAQLAASRDR